MYARKWGQATFRQGGCQLRKMRVCTRPGLRWLNEAVSGSTLGDEEFVQPAFQCTIEGQALPWCRRLGASAEEQLETAPHAGGVNELLGRVVEGASSATFFSQE